MIEVLLRSAFWCVRLSVGGWLLAVLAGVWVDQRFGLLLGFGVVAGALCNLTMLPVLLRRSRT